MDEQPRSEQELTDLVRRLRAADTQRRRSVPSTPEYHEASREIEELAQQVWRTAIADEADAMRGAAEADAMRGAAEADGMRGAADPRGPQPIVADDPPEARP